MRDSPRDDERVQKMTGDSQALVMTLQQDDSNQVCERIVPFVSDSGCNLIIITPTAAEVLGRTRKEVEEPFQVQFGATGSRSTVHQFLDGGRLLGHLYIVDDAASCLIGTVAFTKRGLAVLYTRNLVEMQQDSRTIFVDISM